MSIIKKIGEVIVYPLQWLVFKLFCVMAMPVVRLYRYRRLEKRVEKLSTVGAVFSDSTN